MNDLDWRFRDERGRGSSEVAVIRLHGCHSLDRYMLFTFYLVKITRKLDMIVAYP